MTASISALYIYPIKGCAGVALTEAFLTPGGLEHDRTFMVIGLDGTFRSLRRDPRLALVRPVVEDDRLVLRADGMPPLAVPIDTTSARRDVTMFKLPYRGIDQGDTAAGWLSEVLGTPSRLVRVPPEHDRVTDGETPGRAAYSDSGALHLLTTASLRELNGRIAARGGEPVAMGRFRANLVVDGWGEPHHEDRVRRIRVGETELAYAKLAIRCAVMLVDPERAARAGPEPLRTLATYRRVTDAAGVAFGVTFSVLRTGRLAVGDTLSAT
ncbi:MOSC domain-containing protein [Flindersiella endophytica]